MDHLDFNKFEKNALLAESKLTQPTEHF